MKCKNLLVRQNPINSKKVPEKKKQRDTSDTKVAEQNLKTSFTHNLVILQVLILLYYCIIIILL